MLLTVSCVNVSKNDYSTRRNFKQNLSTWEVMEGKSVLLEEFSPTL